MANVVVVRKNQYFDSVFLMAVAHRLSKESGVEDAAAVMGTDANRRTLADMGFDPAQLAGAGPNDLLVALRGREAVVRRLAADLDPWLERVEDAVGAVSVPTWGAAHDRLPGANLAVISVPGAHAAREAHVALDAGLNVFLFSDHVTVEDELALKRKAAARGLLVMGPDCGTAILAGVGVGFANVVRRGPVGVIASSGTGLQEFTCLVHRAGSGISHAIGTGSRDLSDLVGGLSTLAALDALEADPDTRVIAIVSKPPGTQALQRLLEALARSRKPVVVCLLGLREGNLPTGTRFEIARTLDAAASAAVRNANGTAAEPPALASEDRRLGREADRMTGQQRFIRGLFAGGTFCYQAQQILRDEGMTVYSNAPLSGALPLPDPRSSREHSLVDMGADEFTEGKPHPMIDATQRSARIVAESRDPTVALLLLDVVLGYNAAADPAGDLSEAIGSAKHSATQRGGHLAVLASVCGTPEDPQDLPAQERSLEDLGVLVFPSSSQATLAAGKLIRRLDSREAR